MNNPILIMESKKEFFSDNDSIIYESIKANPLIVRKSISTLAQELGISQPALSRFAQNLGYKKYSDFRADFISWFAQVSLSPIDSNGEITYFSTLHSTIKAFEERFTPEYMKEIVDYIKGFKNVYATGLSKSYQPAALLDQIARERQINIRAVSLDYFFTIASTANEDELIIVFTVSINNTIYDVIKQCASKVMVVTANHNVVNLEGIDKSVIVPYVTKDPESSSISPIIFDVFVELLIQYMSIK